MSKVFLFSWYFLYQQPPEPDGQLESEKKPASPIQEDATQDELVKNITMDAVSISDPSLVSQETESLLKKVDYDPYAEDEVSEVSPTPLWYLWKLNRCWRRWIMIIRWERGNWSVPDPSLVSRETESLLKKVDYDPCTEDEVSEVSSTPLWYLRKLNRCGRRWIMILTLRMR